MCDHSESEFMFNLIQLASLWLWGLLPTPTWLNMTLAPPRKRCKHSCVPVLLKACQQNLFPIDVKVTFSRVGIVFASILQLMFYFTLCEVTECSLMTKYNNLLTISLKKKKKEKWRLRLQSVKSTDGTTDHAAAQQFMYSVRDDLVFLPASVIFCLYVLG